MTTPPLQARLEQAVRALQEAVAQLLSLVGQLQAQLDDGEAPAGTGATTTPATGATTTPATSTPGSTATPGATTRTATAAELLKRLAPPGTVVPAQFLQRLDVLARSASPAALEAHAPELAAIGKHLVLTNGSEVAKRLGLDYRDPSVRARCDRSALEQNLAVQSDVLVAVERTLAAPPPAPGDAQGAFTGASLARTLGMAPNDPGMYRTLDLAALELNRVADPAAKSAIVQQLGSLATSLSHQRVTGQDLARRTGQDYRDPETKTKLDALALEKNGELERAFVSDLRAAVAAPPPTAAQGGPASALDLARLLGLERRMATDPDVRHQLKGLAARAGNGANVQAHAIALQELAQTRGQPATGASIAAQFGLDYRDPDTKLEADHLAAKENAAADRGLLVAAQQLLATPATGTAAGSAPSPSGSELARRSGLDAANPAVRRAFDTAAVLLKDSGDDPTIRDARMRQFELLAGSMRDPAPSGRASAQRAGLDYSDPATKKKMDAFAAAQQVAWNEALLQGVLDIFASPVPSTAQGGPASGSQLADTLGLGRDFGADPDLRRQLTALAIRAGSAANLNAHTSELRAVGQTLRTESGADLARAAGESQAYATDPEVRGRYALQAAIANDGARKAVLRTARRILETPLPLPAPTPTAAQPRPTAAVSQPGPRFPARPVPGIPGAPQSGIAGQEALFSVVGRITTEQQAITIQRLSFGRV